MKIFLVVIVSVVILFYAFIRDPYHYQMLSSSEFSGLGEQETMPLSDVVSGDWDCTLVVGPYVSYPVKIGDVSLVPLERYGMDWRENDWLLVFLTKGEITTVVEFEGAVENRIRDTNRLEYIILDEVTESVGMFRGNDTLITKKEDNFSLSAGPNGVLTDSCTELVM